MEEGQVAIKIMHFSCACMPYNKGLFLQVIAPTSGWKGFIFSVIWPLSIFNFISCLKWIWCTVAVWTEINFSSLSRAPRGVKRWAWIKWTQIWRFGTLITHCQFSECLFIPFPVIFHVKKHAAQFFSWNRNINFKAFVIWQFFHTCSWLFILLWI